MDTTHLARRMWTLYEPVHALTCFAPAALTAAHGLGDSFRARCVAQRAAPLGDVPPPSSWLPSVGSRRTGSPMPGRGSCPASRLPAP